MEIEEIKRIIVDQKEESNNFLKTEKIIERELDSDNLKKYLKFPNILVISGVRRSGKSTLAHLLLENEKYGYIDFDDERLAGFGEHDFNIMLQAFIPFFF